MSRVVTIAIIIIACPGASQVLELTRHPNDRQLRQEMGSRR